MKIRHVAHASLAVALASGTLASGFALARQPNEVALEHVLSLAKPYPNLVLQIRLELVRAGLKRDQVACAAAPAASPSPQLAGVRIAPYRCRIGKRMVVIEATPTYLDASGRRLDSTDRAALARAAKVREEKLKWRWQ